MRVIAPRTLTLLLIVSSLAVRPAHAAEPFARFAYGASFVGLPRGVRNIGMGATGTADVTHLSTGYFNPASVAFASATALTGSYEDQPFDLSLSDVLVTSPIPFHSDSTSSAWHFAGSVGYTRLAFPTLEDRTIFFPEGTGTTYDPDDWMASGTAAASWSHGIVDIAAGATGKYIHQQFSDGVSMGSFDFGVVTAFSFPVGEATIRPRLGYAFLNLDTGASLDRTDIVIANEQRGGFGFDMVMPAVVVFGKEVPVASVSLDYDRINKENNSDRDFASGAEMSFANMVHVRYGVIAQDYRTYGLGVGWDYGSVLFRVDYAHADRRDTSLEDLFGESLDRDTFGALIGVRW
jgi:hypothetical protein